MRTEGGYFLLYDGDCRVCALFGRIVSAFDVQRRIRVQPIQDSQRLLPGMPADTVLDAAHAVAPDGRLTTGADAMPTLVGALLGRPPLEARLRASRVSMRALSRVYGILVGLRGHLSCGAGAASAAARTLR